MDSLSPETTGQPASAAGLRAASGSVQAAMMCARDAKKEGLLGKYPAATIILAEKCDALRLALENIATHYRGDESNADAVAEMRRIARKAIYGG